VRVAIVEGADAPWRGEAVVDQAGLVLADGREFWCGDDLIVLGTRRLTMSGAGAAATIVDAGNLDRALFGGKPRAAGGRKDDAAERHDAGLLE
jgi:hypothetical protein